MKDFYYILGTDTNSSTLEIIQAYEKLSEKFRPELNSSDQYFENRFKEIHEAYEILIDPAKRRQYDKRYKQLKKHSGIRLIDIAFTSILFLFTVIFGQYVIKSITNHKATAVHLAPTVSAVSLPVVKHHKKKKHKFKANFSSIAHQHYVNTAVVHAAPSVSSAPTVVSKPTVVNKSVADNKALTHNNTANISPQTSAVPPVVHTANYLYATEVVSNETGVINMRKFDYYSSSVIKVIPTHSKVLVLAKGDGYYKVQFENSTGYVPAWTIQNK